MFIQVEECFRPKLLRIEKNLPISYYIKYAEQRKEFESYKYDITSKEKPNRTIAEFSRETLKVKRVCHDIF